MGMAADERRAVSDLFGKLGPDVPTLCDGWQAKDLAAHLTLRDRRPDAAAGIQVKALASYTQRVQNSFATRPWPELIELVRTGPPKWSPLRLAALDELANGAEYFVHHEDLRRGQSGWEPRPPDTARDEALWKAVRMVGRFTYRRSPVGVTARRTGGEEVAIKKGADTVTITGEPGELLLFIFGRSEVRVTFDGDQQAVATVQGLDRSF
jgi:uncharacterized protein (TIGR03085 family)